SLCGACKEVCPVRLDIPRMLLRLRQEAVETRAGGAPPFPLRMGMKIFALVAARPWAYNLGTRMAGMGTRLFYPGGWMRKLPGLADRLAYPSPQPAALLQKLREEWAALGVENFVEDSEEALRARVKSLIAGKSLLSWDAAELPYGAGACLQGEQVRFGSDPKA